MTFKQEITLNQKDDITIMLLGSKKTIEITEQLRSFLRGMIKGNPQKDSHIEWLESNLSETISEMRYFNRKLEVQE